MKDEHSMHEAVQADKLATLGKLLAEITHDMNTPAGAINAAAVNIQHHLKALLESLWELNRQGMSTQDVQQLFSIVAVMVAMLDDHQRRKPGEVRDEQKRLAEQFEQQGIPNSQSVAKNIAWMDLAEKAQELLVLTDKYDRESILAVLTHCHRILISTRDIKVSIDLLTHLIRALKGYSFPKQEQASYINIHDTLDTALTILNNKLKHNIHVTCHYSDLPPIKCYASELSQVWINLIHNAIQAIRGEGEILIETFANATSVGVRITDNGVGIPVEIQEQIFHGPVTTKSEGEGSGLGLQIVQEIIQKHGGSITLNSIPGKTTFEVQLPQTLPL